MSSAGLLAKRIDAVVIGASSGGVEALSLLLAALPAKLHPALVIVLHLSRDRPSMLADIFTPHCKRPIREAMDKEPIELGTVYFAPPNYHLLIDAGPRLALSVDEHVQYSRPSIDVLFESAADIYEDRLLGIILTGANDDGAAGLAAVHRRGGVTVVQQPSNAQVPHMVLAALQQTTPNFVLPLAGIAELLQTLIATSEQLTPSEKATNKRSKLCHE